LVINSCNFSVTLEPSMITKKLFYVFCELTISLLTPRFATANQGFLAIDVGHSILRQGVLSASGQPEFDFNLGLATTVSDVLSSYGMPVVRIGFDGRMVDLKKRTQLANASRSAFFLSIHHDSVQPLYLSEWQFQGRTRKYTDYASGFSLFVSRMNPEFASSLECASAIGGALKKKGFQPSQHHSERINGESREWADQENGVYFYDDLVVLKTAMMPAVLLEAGVIVNRQEEQYIKKPEVRNAIAMAVQNGLLVCGVIKPA
jgi:N-acetylmuramoyl-L-alanine amidase